VPKFLLSSIGRKLIAAITGLGLLGFLLGHLAGNLQMFIGQDAVNAYAVTLKDLGPILLAMRAGILAFALVHIVLTLKIAAENKAARPEAYAAGGRVQSRASTRSMTLTGLVLIAFVLYHLAHFTWGLTHPEHSQLLDATGRHDVYSMVVMGFQQPLIAGLYVVAMVLLGLHLAHAGSSVFQTLGFKHARTCAVMSRVGPVLGVLLAAGYISIPLGVWFGIIALPAGVTP
jgi:succinate dehydrogenase / fumarate reductase cytochrome b subunit